jgi:nitroimidazol reductase NimA-like FMN-containing flavoprotein (pyridoxamine 5'-phosphate oxidase superfamily)/succinate dehydrogenase hydrophobic anchor subunit
MVSGVKPKKSPARRRVWIHEFILDRVPPFSYLPRFWALIAQLIIMEIAGLLCVVVFSLPLRSAILGTLAISAVVLWSAIAHHISLPLKHARLPKNPADRKTVSKYRRLVFSAKHYEAVAGFVFALILVIYLHLFGKQNLTYWLGGTPEIIPWALSLLLLWEVSYRAGLGMWTSLLSAVRSSWLKRAVVKRGGHVPYGSLDYLEKTDLRDMMMAFPVFLLLPLVLQDFLLLMLVVGYAIFVVSLSAASIYHLRGIPPYPNEIKELLRTGHTAYFGTTDKRGRPHVTPVIYVFDGRSAFIVTSRVSKKLKNIGKNPKATLLVDIRDPEEPLNNRATFLVGRAKIYGVLRSIAHLGQMLRLRHLFTKKYPEYVREYREKSHLLPVAWRTTILLRRLVIRLDVEKMLYWERARLIRLPT